MRRLFWFSLVAVPAAAHAAGLAAFASAAGGEWLWRAVLAYIASEIGPIKRRLDSLERKR